MEIREINYSTGVKLLELLKTMCDNQYVQCPCKVLAVNGNYVDVLPIINDELVNQPLYDVKIQRKETSTAYIYFKVHVGDRGILRFFDRSIENYSINGSEVYNNDDRFHDANDGCFEVGFLPDTEAFEYPENQEIEIGLKNAKFKISVDENGNVNILSEGNVKLDVTGNLTTTVSGTANLTAPTINTKGILNQTGNVNIIGDVTVSGEVTGNYGGNKTPIKLTKHIHTNTTVPTGNG